MKIALDYDDTYTASPVLFDGFIRLAQAGGHSVTFVTWRRPNESNAELEHAASKHGLDIVYCSGKAKMTCFAADVWIDDSPYSICCHAKWADKYTNKGD